MTNRRQYDSESYAAGASASLKKTLQDIDEMVRGGHLEKEGSIREEVRKRIVGWVFHTSERWYKIGFKRGARTADDRLKAKGAIPRYISKNMRVRFLPEGGGCRVRLTARLPQD